MSACCVRVFLLALVPALTCGAARLRLACWLQVRLGLRSWLRHALQLLLLAALCWQACELAYWMVPHARIAWVRSAALQ